MSNWDFSQPEGSELLDREVPCLGHELDGRRVALCITGGIASIKAPLIVRALRKHGADVVVFASQEGLRYSTSDALEWASLHPVVDRLTPAAEHISGSAPFDCYLVAPATYNTINKIASGIADGVVTSTIASAIGRMEAGKTSVVLAPTMHGSLHNSILVESMKKLSRMGVRIVKPRQENGKNNIPDTEELLASVISELSPQE